MVVVVPTGVGSVGRSSIMTASIPIWMWNMAGIMGMMMGTTQRVIMIQIIEAAMMGGFKGIEIYRKVRYKTFSVFGDGSNHSSGTK